MKYIDADLLRKEIERHIKEVKDAVERFTPNMGFFDAKLSGIYDVIAIIDSLQQEQQEVDLDSEIEEYWIATEWSKVITLGKFKVIARYFYGLGQLNSK